MIVGGVSADSLIAGGRRRLTDCGWQAEYLAPEMLDQLQGGGMGYGPEVCDACPRCPHTMPAYVHVARMRVPFRVCV